MTWLYALAVLAVLVTGWAAWALRTGGKLEKLHAAESAAKAQRDQLEIAADRPATPGALAARLRELDGH